MKRRIAATGVGAGMWVYTFHALGVRLLREFGTLARVQPGFTIYDENDRLRLVKEAMKVCGTSDVVLRPEAAQAAISRAKNKLQSPAAYRERTDIFDQHAIANVYEAYEQLLEQRNAVDFDDLLMRVALVLRGHPEIVERLNVRFRYVLIDEYQDTNHAQYLIARHLSQHHHNICATGDPDQSIYGWRGADLGNILDFERDYPKAVVVRLEQNYRSTGNILHAASSLIAGNRRRKHKDLWTENSKGELVRVWRFSEGRDESERIADTIAQMHADGRPYSDMAIFYRVNALSRGLEDALRGRSIPYRIARGVEFYNRKEIRDTLAYLRVLVNPADQIALLRIINTPTRGIGKTTIERLVAFAEREERPLLEVMRTPEQVSSLKAAAKKVRAFVELLDRLKTAAEGAVADAVSSVLSLSGLEAAFKQEHEDGGEDRLANAQELVTAAASYDTEAEEPTLSDFLQRIALVSDQDAVDESAGVVMLMTLHAAKGLEFPVVFVVGLEQGLLPHENALRESVDVEEERRLCFVGITRAEQQLFLTHAGQRMIRGVLMPRPASQFLRELDSKAMKVEDFGRPSWQTSAGGGAARRRSEEEADADGFVPLHDHLPPEERRGRMARQRRLRAPEFGDVDEDVRIIDAAADAAPTASPYAGWKTGTFVTHKKYGVGQVVWIRPGGGQTRAAIRFASYGEKTFILELTPIQKLERR